MYNYIIWDIDGTLMDTVRADLLALQKMLLVETEKHYELEDLTMAIGVPGKVTLAQLGIANREEAHKKWISYFMELHPQIKLFAGITEILAQLHRLEIPMGIVTSKTRSQYDDDMALFAIDHYFSHVICVEDTTHHKPNPEPMVKLLEIAGIKGNEAIYIGDTISDYQCASSAGVSFALALWGTYQKDGIPTDHLLTHPQDILKLISKKQEDNKEDYPR